MFKHLFKTTLTFIFILFNFCKPCDPAFEDFYAQNLQAEIEKEKDEIKQSKDLETKKAQERKLKVDNLETSIKNALFTDSLDNPTPLLNPLKEIVLGYLKNDIPQYEYLTTFDAFDFNDKKKLVSGKLPYYARINFQEYNLVITNSPFFEIPNPYIISRDIYGNKLVTPAGVKPKFGRDSRYCDLPNHRIARINNQIGANGHDEKIEILLKENDDLFKNNKILKTFKKPVCYISYVHNNFLACVPNECNAIHFMNLDTGDYVSTININQCIVDKTIIIDIAASNDGKYLAASLKNDKIIVWIRKDFDIAI